MNSMKFVNGVHTHSWSTHVPEWMVCGYEVRTSCEVSPSSVTSDGTASVSTVEAV